MCIVVLSAPGRTAKRWGTRLVQPVLRVRFGGAFGLYMVVNQFYGDAVRPVKPDVRRHVRVADLQNLAEGSAQVGEHVRQPFQLIFLVVFSHNGWVLVLDFFPLEQ